MRREFSTIIAVLLLIAIVTPASAASMDTQEIPTFDEWLKAASGPAVSVIVGFLISLLLDVWPAYGELSATWKTWLYGGFCLVVPVAAASLRALLGYVPWSFDPLVWHALWSGAAAAIAGTVVHKRKAVVMRE